MYMYASAHVLIYQVVVNTPWMIQDRVAIALYVQIQVNDKGQFMAALDSPVVRWTQMCGSEMYFVLCAVQFLIVCLSCRWEKTTSGVPQR